jgi:hypothetical protein
MADRAQLYNDPEEAFRIAFEGKQSGMWTAIPCIVTAVDLTKMTCSAQPAIQGTVEDENGVKQSVNYPMLVDVPICFPKAGGFLLTLPIAVNDEVLVVFSSRCIDAWWQSGGIQRPMEARMHDLSDGFAIPGPCSVPNVPAGAISATGAQLRNAAGTTYIEIAADGKIKLVSPAGVEVTGNLTVTGVLNFTGNLVVSGTVTALDFIAGLLGFTTHKHTGVTTGAGTSGGPTP